MKKYEMFHDRTGQPVVGGQSSSSVVPSVIKTEVPLDNDDSAHNDFPLQQYGKRIEELSQQDKLSKFCMDAGFLHVVEIGQHFMTEDTGDLTQFHAVACREYTLGREEGASQPRGWIQGNTKIGPVLEVATSYLHSKYGVEIRIMSLNRDNTHSWVRISHGSNKFVMNLNNNKQETSEMQFDEYALKLNASDFASRSKAKAKTLPQELDLLVKEFGPMLNQENIQSPIMWCRRKIHLLRHGRLPRENDGAIEFWRIKDYLRDHFVFCHHWSDDKWKKSMAREGGNKKRYQYCTDSSGTILHVRALQSHSGRNLLLPIQLSCRMCNQFAFHHQFGIDIWMSKFEQQTDSVLLAY